MVELVANNHLLIQNEDIAERFKKIILHLVILVAAYYVFLILSI